MIKHKIRLVVVNINTREKCLYLCLYVSHFNILCFDHFYA